MRGEVYLKLVKDWVAKICLHLGIYPIDLDGKYIGWVIYYTPGPWLLQISVVCFSLAQFQKIAQISSLCNFYYMRFGLLMTWVLRIWFLGIFASRKKTHEPRTWCIWILKHLTNLICISTLQIYFPTWSGGWWKIQNNLLKAFELSFCSTLLLLKLLPFF